MAHVRLLRNTCRLGIRNLRRRIKSRNTSRRAQIKPRATNSLLNHRTTNPEPPGYLTYREVLRRVIANIGTELRLQFSDEDLSSLPESMSNWPVFPDAEQALNTLKTRYKLAVISNVDDDLFASSAKALNVDFDLVVTAQQVQSYKSDLRNFEFASALMAVENHNWLHVAVSLYHDIGPANQLGIKSVWVNRPNRGGGTRHTNAVPDMTITDLTTLAQMLRMN